MQFKSQLSGHRSNDHEHTGFARDVDRALKEMEERMYRMINERLE
jgi:hypothetical protein